jgi:hypothetical protein
MFHRTKGPRMKPLLVAATVLAASLPAAAANVDVGVSIGISQPGVYGRIDIGAFPPPQVIVAQPVIVGRPIVRPVQPVYMWVPPGHQKHWRRHCAAYGACGVPVYFVQDRWYRDHVYTGGGYAPRHGWRDGRWHDRPDRYRDERDDDRDDRRSDSRRGQGPGGYVYR